MDAMRLTEIAEQRNQPSMFEIPVTCEKCGDHFIMVTDSCLCTKDPLCEWCADEAMRQVELNEPDQLETDDFGLF